MKKLIALLAVVSILFLAGCGGKAPVDNVQGDAIHDEAMESDTMEAKPSGTDVAEQAASEGVAISGETGLSESVEEVDTLQDEEELGSTEEFGSDLESEDVF